MPTAKITVDVLRPNYATQIYAKQLDQLSRVVELTMVEGSQPWTPPDNAVPVVRYYKPDGTAGFYDTLENDEPAVSVSGNAATLTLAAQATTVPGDVNMELDFYTADAVKVSTFAWVLRVQPSAVDDSQIKSSDYYNALTETVAHILAALPNIENAKEYADAAAASATDKKLMPRRTARQRQPEAPRLPNKKLMPRRAVQRRQPGAPRPLDEKPTPRRTVPLRRKKVPRTARRGQSVNAMARRSARRMRRIITTQSTGQIKLHRLPAAVSYRSMGAAAQYSRKRGIILPPMSARRRQISFRHCRRPLTASSPRRIA